MGNDITLKNVRFNWLHVLKPNKRFGNYQAEILIEPGSDAFKAVEQAVLDAATEKWGAERAETAIKVARSGGKCCWKPGESMKVDKNTGELAPHYEGVFVLSSSRKPERDGAPKVYSVRKSTGKLVPVDGDTKFDDDLVKPTPGFYGDVIVNVWAFEYDGSEQVNCTLNVLAAKTEGDQLGGRAEASDEDVAKELGIDIEEPII